MSTTDLPKFRPATQSTEKQCQLLTRCGFFLVPLGLDNKGTYKAPVWTEWQKGEKCVFDHASPLFARYGDWGWPIEHPYVILDLDHPDKLHPDLKAILDKMVPASSASGKKHYLFECENPPSKKVWDWGELLIPGRDQAKMVGDKCSQPDEFIRREDVPPLPVELLGQQQVDKSGTGSTMSVPPDYSAEPPATARNIKLSKIAGLVKNLPDQDGAEDFILWLGKYWGLDDKEIQSTVLDSYRKRFKSEQETEPAEEILELYTVDDIINANWPTQQIWHQELQAGPGMAVMVAGVPGSGKSTLILQTLFEINKPALYLYAEGTLPQLKERMGYPDNKCVVTARQKGRNDFLKADYTPYGVIAIDTKMGAYTAQADENSVEHWEELRLFCDKWKDQGKLVIFTHHTNKAGNAFRGSTEALAFVDVCTRLMKDTHELAHPEFGKYMMMEKNRHGELLHTHYKLVTDRKGPTLQMKKMEYL